MNYLTKTFLIFFALGFLASACKKDDVSNPSNESQNFSEYFYCKINGEEFTPQGNPYCNSKAFHFYTKGSGGLDDSYMLIRGQNCNTDKSVLLRFFGAEVFTGNMDMLNPAYADSCSPLVAQQETPDSYYYRFEKLQSGFIDISSFSPRETNGGAFGKVEGTFAFVLTDETIDSTVHITDGAFRFKVPNMW